MLIVLESIDGGGKGRQREEITAYIAQNFPQIELLSLEFPVHNIFYESVIHPALQGETKLNKASWLLSFLLDKTLHTDELRKFSGDQQNLCIVDGYFTSTIAYQAELMQQIDRQKLLELGDLFEIPKPDLAIYIDVDPEIALQRKQVEEGHSEGPDMFEKSLVKQKKLRKIFTTLSSEQIYCNWDMVNGNVTIPEVTAQILAKFTTHKII